MAASDAGVVDERCVPASSTVSSNTSCSQLELSKMLYCLEFGEYFILKQRDMQGLNKERALWNTCQLTSHTLKALRLSLVNNKITHSIVYTDSFG